MTVKSPSNARGCESDNHTCASFQRWPVGRAVMMRDYRDSRWVRGTVVFVTCESFQAEQRDLPEETTHWWRRWNTEGRDWRLLPVEPARPPKHCRYCKSLDHFGDRCPDNPRVGSLQAKGLSDE